MKVNVLDLQRKYWHTLGCLPHSFLKKVRLVYVLGLTGTDVFLVTNNQKFFFYGLNDNLHNQGRLFDITNLTEIDELSQKHIKEFSCNSQHCKTNIDLFVVSLLMNGEVYLWGCSPSECRIVTVPNLIEGLPKTVVQVACGAKHVLALTSDGKVYAWGDNRCGQTACALTKPLVFKPRRIQFPFGDVAKIACGSDFSVVVTREHKVYGWGRNSDGQLGTNKSKKNDPIIRELSEFKNACIHQIACGDRHVLALNDCGALFSCGNNEHGQLGFDDEFEKNIIPGAIRTSDRFKEIAASNNSSVGETLDGEIMVWGSIGGETNHSPMKTPCRSMNEAFALYRLNGMHKQIEVTKESENVNQTVAEAVRKSFGNQETSDFKIIVEEKEIYVHKSILAIRSKYFGRLFEKNWLEGRRSCIRMDDSYEGMSAFLKYLYTDEIDDVDVKVLVDLVMIAKKFCELCLVKLCVQQFESDIDASNVAELYELTLDRKLSNFNELCINFASSCLREVVVSEGYKSWHPETFKTFFQHDKIISCLRE